jgi:hypothetical protein
MRMATTHRLLTGARTIVSIELLKDASGAGTEVILTGVSVSML